MSNDLTPKAGTSITPMDRGSAMTPLKMAAAAAAPLAVFKKARAAPRLPHKIWAAMYGYREPDPGELASLAADCEILFPAMHELEAEIRSALEAKPDRSTLRMLLGLMIDAHLPSAAAVRSSDAEAAIEEMILIAVDHGFGHFIVARARRILLETARFAISGADLLTACETAKTELVSALSDIKLRKRIAAIIAEFDQREPVETVPHPRLEEILRNAGKPH